MNTTNAFHYLGCGLPNIYLANGYTLRNTPFGEVVSIENLSGLHECIAEQVINQTRLMNGAELKFIRKQLQLSRKMLAEMIGVSDQTIMRMEKKEKSEIQKSTDLLLRTFYKECLGEDASLRALLSKLQDLDDQNHKKEFTFQESKEGWGLAVAA